MRITLWSILSLLLILGTDLRPVSVTQTKALVVTNVTVIDATGAPARPDMTVVISNGRISAIGPSGLIKAPPGSEVIDAAGKYLIPGLWDMHLHLTIIPDQAITRQVIAPTLVAYGITSARDMGGDWPRIEELRREITEGKIIGPQIISPGPFVDGPEPPATFFVSVNSEDEARRAVRKLTSDGVDFIKVQSQLSLDCWRAVLSEAQKLNVPVVGHIPERVSAFEVARSSQRSIEHVSAISPGDAGVLLACSTKETSLRAEMLDIERLAAQPGADQKSLVRRQHELESQMISTFDGKKCDSLLALFGRNHTYAVPTQVYGQRIAPLTREDSSDDSALRLIPKSMREHWKALRESTIKNSSADDFSRRRLIAEQSRLLVGRMHQAGMQLMSGTDAIDDYVIPGLSLHQELELMVASGLTPMQALQTATRTPAEFLGKLSSMGTIETGKIADLVLLSADPLENISNTKKIEVVIQGGRLLDRKALDRILLEVESAAASK